MLDEFLDLIASAIIFVVDIVIDIIDGIIDFWNDVVGYFKKLSLVRGRDIPFIADPELIKNMLRDAPVIETNGIFEAVYDEDTNQIKNSRFVCGDDLDNQTKAAIHDKGIAVLN